MAILRSDTKQAMLEGLRQALQLDMQEFFDIATAAASTDEAAMALFNAHLAYVAERYEMMVDAVDALPVTE